MVKYAWYRYDANSRGPFLAVEDDKLKGEAVVVDQTENDVTVEWWLGKNLNLPTKIAKTDIQIYTKMI